MPAAAMANPPPALSRSRRCIPNPFFIDRTFLPLQRGIRRHTTNIAFARIDLCGSLRLVPSSPPHRAYAGGNARDDPTQSDQAGGNDSKINLQTLQ
jgi:hypothetical protein